MLAHAVRVCLAVMLAALLGASEADQRQLLEAAQELAGTMARGDVAAARTANEAYGTAWIAAEDAIRARDKATYAAIEEAMGDLTYALQADSYDEMTAKKAAQQVLGLTSQVIGAPQAAAAPVPSAPAATGAPTLAGLCDQVRSISEALAAGRQEAAVTTMAQVRRQWPDVEGAVKTRDSAAYREIEDLLARSAAQLKAGDPTAAASLMALKARMEPFTSASAYGVADALLILLREGVEALLVIVALLSFLRRSGHADRQGAIWWGAAAGVVVSLVLAVVIHLVFRTAFSGVQRELVEGVVGLAAAGLLFWVSWWLHRAANLARWNGYIADRTRAALATGSVVSLGVLAFLAVLREGAETALFYLGMAPSIATRDLLLGIGIGAVLLAILGVVVVRVGVRLPLRPFFIVLGVLVLAMGVKFIGAGVQALQVAQLVPASVIDGLPSIALLGVFPTWETLGAQALAIAVVILVMWLGSRPPAPTPQPV